MLYLNEFSLHSQSFEHYIYQGDLSFDAHFHTDYEVTYVISGEDDVTVDGVTRRVCAGDFVLVLPYQVHSCRSVGKMHIWFADFSPDLVNTFSHDMRNCKGRHFCFSGAGTAAETMVRKYAAELPAHAHNQLVRAGEVSSTYEAQSMLYAICAEYARQVEIVPNAAPSDELIGRIAQYIQAHFREDITLAQLAADLNYDRYYLSRLFNRVFHMNFRQYVNSCRVSYAKQLMLETKQGITTIAGECGYQSIRTFNHAFFSLTGLTPTAFRQPAGGAR